MKHQQPGRLVILSGPSCVGKSPLVAALARLYPELHAALKPLVLYNSRAARPGETDGVDYHFRSREYVETLRADKRFVVMDVRGDLQALDLHELSAALQDCNVLFEGNPFVGSLLLEHPSLTRIERLSVFMSPLSRQEILFLRQVEPTVSLPDLLTDVMRRKLLRRTRRQKGELSLPDLQNIEKRAASAYGELKLAHRFAHIIPNHDGEDSDHWSAFYHPLGEARIAMLAFVALLQGRPAAGTESWKEDLLA